MRNTLTAVTLTALSVLVISGKAFAAGERGDCLPEIQAQQDQILRQHIDDSVNLATNIYPKKSSSFSELSCLENIMNSGTNIFFSPPGLDDLIGKLKSFACGAIDSQYYKLTSSISMNSSIPLGEAVPGLNIGSIGGGFGVSPGAPSTTLPGSVESSVSRVKNQFNTMLGNR